MALLLDERARVGVVGAGAMGTGIAQVAAHAGHDVTVVDTRAEALEQAGQVIRKALARDVEKGRVSVAEATAIQARVQFARATDLSSLRDCALVVEAIVEDLDVKRETFAGVEAVVDASAVLASNTSSLSVTAIASACRIPQRVIGLHFFNPATMMPLVEVVGGLTSDPAIVTNARGLMVRWNKAPVVAADTPGFIVNRVARPYYGESLRILEEGMADIATIDWALRDVGRFKMGPFELMDLIGNDVNYAVTRSVFEALGFDPRYKPSITQRRMVEARRLGRKTGTGYYDYTTDAPRPQPRSDPELATRIVDRVVAMLINEAADAVLLNVATPADIDLAMTKGVNYPKGLLAWADEIGIGRVVERLAALQDEYGEDRYRPSALLKRMAREGRRFHS